MRAIIFELSRVLLALVVVIGFCDVKPAIACTGTVIGGVQILTLGGGSRSVDLCSGDSSLSVPLSQLEYQVNITTNSNANSSTNVPRVVLSGASSSSAINVVVGGVAWRSTDTSPLTLTGNWRGLETSALTSGATVLLYGGVSGDLIGAVYADTISRFDVGGTMNTTILIGNSGGLNIIEMGSFGSSGAITMSSGVFQRVRVNSDGFAGQLDAGTGSINAVIASGNIASTAFIKALHGGIGNISAGGSISASQITAQDHIIAIDALGGAITNTTITANYQATGSNPGSITRITSTSGGFTGSLTAKAISGGNDNDGIKLTGSNANLSANITISGDVGRQIDVAGNSTGAITIGGGLNTGNSSRLLHVGGTASGAINITGSVSTPVSINTLAGDLTVGGDVASGGSITVTNGLPSIRTIKIGGSLAGSITLPAGGLQGQILVNANNASGTWTGTVNVDGTAITAPAAGSYTTASSALGGGAVGLVPYRLYANDCSPVNNTLIPAAHGDPKITKVTTDFNASGDNSAVPIKIRFYGPLMFGDTGSWTSAVTIECTPLSNDIAPCAGSDIVHWMDVTQAFLVRGMNDGVSGWTEPRAIGLSRHDSTTFIGPGIYRVRFPDIFSAGVDASADPALVKAAKVCSAESLSAAYYFRVGADCNENLEDDQVDPAPGACSGGCADINHDGAITVTDIFNFLSSWFGNCTAVTTDCPYGSADFNHSGSITVSDIFNFLTAWFAGPAACH